MGRLAKRAPLTTAGYSNYPYYRESSACSFSCVNVYKHAIHTDYPSETPDFDTLTASIDWLMDRYCVLSIREPCNIRTEQDQDGTDNG